MALHAHKARRLNQWERHAHALSTYVRIWNIWWCVYAPYARKHRSTLQYAILYELIRIRPRYARQVEKESTTHVHFSPSLLPWLSEKSGIWKLSTLRLKATCEAKSRRVSSWYRCLATCPAVPSPGSTFFSALRISFRVVTRMEAPKYGETLKFMYTKYQPVLVVLPKVYQV
mgnify:CR=1 FL=1